MLKRYPGMRGLSDEEVGRIAHDCQVVELARGERLHEPGQVLTCMYFVGHGRLERQLTDLRGNEITRQFLTRGCQFGAVVAAQVEPVPITVVALEPSVVLQLDYQKFLQYVAELPQLLLNFIQTEFLIRGVKLADLVLACTRISDGESILDRLRALLSLEPEWRQKIGLVWCLEGSQRQAPWVPDLGAMVDRYFKVSFEPPPKCGAVLNHGLERIVHRLRGVCVGIALGGGAARGMGPPRRAESPGTTRHHRGHDCRNQRRGHDRNTLCLGHGCRSYRRELRQGPHPIVVLQTSASWWLLAPPAQLPARII